MKAPKRTAAELAGERALTRGIIESMTRAQGYPPRPRRKPAGSVLSILGWIVLATLILASLAYACR